MSVIEGAPKRVRNVRILAAGGTISMTEDSGGGGGSATPDRDADALFAAIPGLAGDGIEVSTLSNVPSAHLSLDDQLRICRAARDFARRGIGVVVTHGTDTMEETAMLCDVLHDAEAPIVFTGAIRPASAPGADGPANTLDAVSVAASEAAAGMGVLVCFGGEIHHARCVRKTDTTSLTAFSSPQTGPLGRVSEAHPTIWSRMPRNPPLDPPHLECRVVIVPTASGDDGTLARAALDTGPDGAVIGTLGAGHLNPDLLELWQRRRRDDPGGRLLPLRARGDPQRDLRLPRLRAGSARWPDHPGRLPLAAGGADEAARLPRLGPRDRRDPLGLPPGRRLALVRGWRPR